MVKNPPANAEDSDSVPGSGRSPGEGNGNPLQYSCLENPWSEGPGRLHAVRGVKESDVTKHIRRFERNLNLKEMMARVWGKIVPKAAN